MSRDFDRIDWKRLSHAYGPATNVPGLLQLLTDPSAAAREEAMMELCNCINHQGSIYEATVRAVPCLFELAEDPSVPDRPGVLGILEGISEAWTAAVRDQPADPLAWPIRWRDVAERVTWERPFREAAHRAVEDRFESLAGYLRDPVVPVRVAAAFVLATFLDRREEAAQALRQMVDEEADDWCRAAATLALTELVRHAPEAPLARTAVERFRKIHADERSGPDSRLCAGIALLHLGETDGLKQTLGLAGPRLSQNRTHFYALPSRNFSRNLFGLVCDSLRKHTDPRIDWIREGLAQPDPEVLSDAFFETSRLCREVRWGPSRFLPDLLKLADGPDEKTRTSAVLALHEMGLAGRESFVELARHPAEDVRIEVARCLEWTRLADARRLTEWKEERASPLPALETLIRTIEVHQDSRRWSDKEHVCEALMQLGFHGPAAATAVDHIRGLTGNATPEVRMTAIRALWRVTGDAGAVVPLLLENLQPEPRYGFLVIEQLRELGPAAREALPALRKISDSEHRFADEGSISTSCSDDDAFRAAAVRAVAAIERR